MKKIFTLLCIVLVNIGSIYADNCKRVVLQDDFSSSSYWTSVGNGTINIGSGLCNYSNVIDGSDTRVYRSLGTTLSDTYFKAECKFSILNANASGHGTTAYVMVLSQGTSTYETSSNAIDVFINSASASDNNISNWYFGIGYYKGGVYTNSTLKIYASPTITDYYIRLERISVDSTQLSIFSDASFTTPLPGSPFKFAIDPTLTGFNTVQHATCTVGATIRQINATVDNDYICDDFQTPASVCNNIIFTDNFLSASGWTSVGGGTINISGGLCNYNNVIDGSDTRVYRSLGATLSNTYFKAECDFSILGTNASGHGTTAYIIALTNGTNTYESAPYAIDVFINSISPSDNNINNWYFGIGTSIGGTSSNSTATIYASSTISNYYIRLERFTIDSAKLSVFTDASFTTPLTGSPSKFKINSSITGLNTVQHATCTAGATIRVIDATVDNDMICDNSATGITHNENETNDLIIYPNPVSQFLTVKSSERSMIQIINLEGQILSSINANANGTTINVGNLSAGVYFVKLTSDKGVSIQKFIKE